MKKAFMLFALSLVLICIMSSPVMAKGGIGPMLGSCCLGPRIGLEMNEDVDIEFLEVLRVIGPVTGPVHLWLAYDYGYKSAEEKGFLASCCLGPRIGKELDERKIRTKEFLILVPIVNLYPWITTGMEAYEGKTMTEVAEEENLNR